MSDSNNIQDMAARRCVKVTLERPLCHTHWPCAICGGWTEKDDVVATFLDPENPEESQVSPDTSGECFVCDDCLKVGDTAVPAEFRKRAAILEENAAELRRIADTYSWSLPSYEAWRAANGFTVDLRVVE